MTYFTGWFLNIKASIKVHTSMFPDDLPEEVNVIVISTFSLTP
jgi:hypothetical protein